MSPNLQVLPPFCPQEATILSIVCHLHRPFYLISKTGTEKPFNISSFKIFLFRPVLLKFPGGSDGKLSAYNSGEGGSIPGSGRSPGEGNGNPLQYSCLENPMDGGAW